MGEHAIHVTRGCTVSKPTNYLFVLKTRTNMMLKKKKTCVHSNITLVPFDRLSFISF